MIFKDLVKEIKGYKISKEQNDLESFEKNVENLISNIINNYPKYRKEYIKNIEIDIKNLKTLVSERVPPESESYPEV